MAILVMKFGGTSVADLDKIANASQKVKREVENGYQVIVVVSAMSGKTNELVGWVRETSKFYDGREYDAVVASGEIVTSGLMALRLQEEGIDARSWQGWQIPIETTSAHGAARIIDIGTQNILDRFDAGMNVAVVAGFQGISHEGRVTTLGRGGSDTTAVALAAAFKAERCDIYTDVDGVYTTDPRITKKATKLSKIAHEEMLELASAGAKVLQTRSVELAMRYDVPLQVRSSFSDEPGTLVVSEDEIMELNVVSGVAFSRDEAKVTVDDVLDQPGIAAKVFGPLAKAGINVDMIVQDVSYEGLTSMSFTVPEDQLELSLKTLNEAKASGDLEFKDLFSETDVAKVSIVGIGMRSHAGVASQMFDALAKDGVNIKVITTSEIKVSVLIEQKYLELAVQSLHDSFGLDKLS